jgi:hypothetical protein
MHRPPHNVISGVFNEEFAADIIVYGIMGAAPLLCFVIVVYIVSNGNLGTNGGSSARCLEQSIAVTTSPICPDDSVRDHLGTVPKPIRREASLTIPLRV